jgi:hypothetical protein
MRADWISPWWQAACLPDWWDVCGVKCPALTVWHTFALEQIGNPYLCGGPVDHDAAAALLLFARHERAGGRKLMLMPHYRARQMRRMFRMLRGIPGDEIHAACSEYVEVCTRGISRWRKNGSKPAAVPYQWHMVARIGDRAWDMPYAYARAVCDALAEQAGDDSIMTLAAQEMEDNWPEYAKEAVGVN